MHAWQKKLEKEKQTSSETGVVYFTRPIVNIKDVTRVYFCVIFVYSIIREHACMSEHVHLHCALVTTCARVHNDDESSRPNASNPHMLAVDRPTKAATAAAGKATIGSPKVYGTISQSPSTPSTVGIFLPERPLPCQELVKVHTGDYKIL